MTFSDGFPALQTVIDREETFGEWAVKNIDRFFLPKREPNYALESIIHFFMARLHQSYETVMNMDEERRDTIFRMEKEIADKQK